MQRMRGWRPRAGGLVMTHGDMKSLCIESIVVGGWYNNV